MFQCPRCGCWRAGLEHPLLLVSPHFGIVVWMIYLICRVVDYVVESNMVSLYDLSEQSINVYTMDHRGTGRSHYLDCEAAQAFTGGSPNGQALANEELKACIDDVLFQTDGQSVAFSVTSAAMDVRMLIEELHTDKDEIFVYGVSYGTYLVERVVHLAPARVKGYILDGVISEAGGDSTTQLQFSHWNQNILPPSRRFFEICAQQIDCPLKLNASIPVLDQVQEMYSTIDSQTESNPCVAAFVSLTQSPEPSFVLRELLGALVRDGWSRKLVPSLLARFLRCNKQDLEELNVTMNPLLNRILRSAPSLQFGIRNPMLPKLQVDPVETSNPLLYMLIATSELWGSPSPTEEDMRSFFYDGVFSQPSQDLGTYCAITGNLQRNQLPEPACADMAASVHIDSSSPFTRVKPFVYEPDIYWNKTAALPPNTSALFFSGGLDFQTPSEFARAQFDAMGAPETSAKLHIEMEFGVHGTGMIPTMPEDMTQCGMTIILDFVRRHGQVQLVNTSCLVDLPKLQLDDTSFQTLLGLYD